MFGVEEKAHSNYYTDRENAKKRQEEFPEWEDVKDQYLANVLSKRKDHTKNLWESHKLHSGIAKAMNSV